MDVPKLGHTCPESLSTLSCGLLHIGKGLRQRDTSSTYLQQVLLWGGKTRGRDRLRGWHLFNMIVHDLRTMETQITQ